MDIYNNYPFLFTLSSLAPFSSAVDREDNEDKTKVLTHLLFILPHLHFHLNLYFFFLFFGCASCTT